LGVTILLRIADAAILSGGVMMAKLPEEAKKIIAEIHPAFVATATKDGKPNVSPKGSFRVLDDEHVIFAEMASPRTIANLKENPQISAIVYDLAAHKGCRIWGKAEVLDSGDLVDALRAEFAARKMPVNLVVKVAVEEAAVISM
jgi:predicted pyridoxine 5'-phosphate oxidase superfamily flavin-nucleotide-binding protein